MTALEDEVRAALELSAEALGALHAMHAREPIEACPQEACRRLSAKHAALAARCAASDEEL